MIVESQTAVHQNKITKTFQLQMQSKDEYNILLQKIADEVLPVFAR